MKRVIRLFMAGLVLAAGTQALDAQRGMRWMNDSSATNRPGREFRQGQMSGNRSDTALFRGRNAGRADFYPLNNRRGPVRSPAFIPGGRSFPQGQWRHPGRNYGRGMHNFRGYGFMQPDIPVRPRANNRPLAERIPDLTEKQKKDIDNLRQKQQEEMRKFREENRKSAESMRKSHMDNMMKVLTPEQKEWLEGQRRPGAVK